MVLLIVVAAVAAGCGDDTSDPLPAAGTAPAVGATENRETALLSDVRTEARDGYDRVTFVFTNAVPGYDVRYADGPVRADGSGDTVDVGGEAALVVRMDNALDADLSDPEAPMTYTGPQRLVPELPAVAELRRVGGFEGVLTWALGLAGEQAFAVSTLPDPPTLIVDVLHP